MAVSCDPQILIDLLNYKKKFDYPVFVETGTSNGQSTLMFSRLFENTYTCDNMKEGEADRIETLSCGNNIVYKLGDSKDCLPIFFQEIGHDKFFLFLDAHGTSWPILDELQIVADFGYKPFIFIHDFDCGHEGWRYDCWGPNDEIKLNHEYVKPLMESIYGIDGYVFEVSQECQMEPASDGVPNLRGCGFFFPKN